MFIKKLTLVFALLALPLALFAQEKFTEGTITYNITISGKIPTPANEPSLTESKSGTLTISVKGDNVREDIKLEDGYTHSQIRNYATEKEIILQTINTIKYAIEIHLKDLRKKNADFYGAERKAGPGKKEIAGNAALESTLRYKNGQQISLFYLPGFELKHPELYDRFPELKGIPAEYSIPMSNGFTTQFVLTRIAAEPISNAVFKIPEGYRIISRKEYEKLLR